MRRCAAVIATTVLLSTAAAQAQGFGGASSSDLLGYRSSAGHYYSRSFGTQLRDRPTRPRPLVTPVRPDARRRVDLVPASTMFRPVGPPIFPARLAAAVPRNPAARRYFEDLLAAYTELLAKRGGAPNDVSRAAAFLVSNSHHVLSGTPLSDAQFEGLRGHMRELIGTDPGFRRLDDRQRQELYERYAVFGMHLLTAQSYFTRTRDARELAKTRALAREQIEDVFGLPAEHLVFRNDGVHLR